MSWTFWVASGAALGGLAVGAGAFGAHALREHLSAGDLAIFETAARYQMYHAIALVLVGLVGTRIDGVFLKIAGIGFLVGTLIFSGSLYGLVLSGNRQLGMLTPVGGLALISAWLALGLAVLR